MGRTSWKEMGGNKLRRRLLVGSRRVLSLASQPGTPHSHDSSSLVLTSRTYMNSPYSHSHVPCATDVSSRDFDFDFETDFHVNFVEL
jgi:hypothetical protein